MTNVSTVTFSQRLREYLREAAQGREVINVRTEDGNVILMGFQDYDALMKHSDEPKLKNEPVHYTKDEFYQKIDRGLEQVHAGFGIVKTLDELKAIERELIREDG